VLVARFGFICISYFSRLTDNDAITKLFDSNTELLGVIVTTSLGDLSFLDVPARPKAGAAPPVRPMRFVAAPKQRVTNTDMSSDDDESPRPRERRRVRDDASFAELFVRVQPPRPEVPETKAWPSVPVDRPEIKLVKSTTGSKRARAAAMAGKNSVFDKVWSFNEREYGHGTFGAVE
jgi:hypothetical protein